MSERFIPAAQFHATSLPTQRFIPAGGGGAPTGGADAGFGVGDAMKWGQVGLKGAQLGNNVYDAASAAGGFDPATLANAGNALGAINLILSGLRAGGVLNGDASQVLSGLSGVASAGLTGAALTAAPTLSASLAAMPTLSALGAIGGGVTSVAAPFIAMGLHSLEKNMRPNTIPATRKLNEQLWEGTSQNVGAYNQLAEQARAAGISDPEALQALLKTGENSVLDYYNKWVPVGDDTGIPGIGRDASPSGQVGGFDATTQGQMMAPFRQAMMNVAALNNATGGQAPGSNDWYGIFGGQLDQRMLPGSFGLNAAQYGERYTPEQLKAAAGGLNPLDFALQQYQQSSPDWNVQQWPGMQMAPAKPLEAPQLPTAAPEQASPVPGYSQPELDRLWALQSPNMGG